MCKIGMFDMLGSEKDSKGYSEIEMDKIERLYDIVIRGDLREFMRLAGRSAGRLLGDSFSLMYSPSMSVRDHLLYQEGRRIIISEDLGRNEIVVEKPFFFSEAMSTYAFFIKTKPMSVADANKVYCLDENADEISEEKLLFVDFIADRIKRREITPPKRDVVCVGEMIEI